MAINLTTTDKTLRNLIQEEAGGRGKVMTLAFQAWAGGAPWSGGGRLGGQDRAHKGPGSSAWALQRGAWWHPVSRDYKQVKARAGGLWRAGLGEEQELAGGSPPLWGSAKGFCPTGDGGNLGRLQSKEKGEARPAGRTGRAALGTVFDFHGFSFPTCKVGVLISKARSQIVK